MNDCAKWLEKLSDEQLRGQAHVAHSWLAAEKLHGARPRADYAERFGQIETELALRVDLLEELV